MRAELSKHAYKRMAYYKWTVALATRQIVKLEVIWKNPSAKEVMVKDLKALNQLFKNLRNMYMASVGLSIPMSAKARKAMKDANKTAESHYDQVATPWRQFESWR
jgi:hypothetical protein